jgi:hypothetical protein
MPSLHVALTDISAGNVAYRLLIPKTHPTSLRRRHPLPNMSAPTTFAQMAEWMVAANAKIDRLELWLARSTASNGQLRLVVSQVHRRRVLQR